jgi:hypothetical protein
MAVVSVKASADKGKKSKNEIVPPKANNNKYN